MTGELTPGTAGAFLIYQTEDGRTRVQVRLEEETVWLTQKQMAELFQKDVRTVSEHIRNIFDEGELRPDSVVRDFRITAADGKQYVTQHYNLDVIISVGYRVRSLRGTQVRICATQRLREYIVKGFTMNDERPRTAEIIRARADADKPDMVLTNWTGGSPRKADVGVARNYLDEDEFRALNLIVAAYLDFAELQAVTRRPITMSDWIAKLDDFIRISDRQILTHAGGISHDLAPRKAEAELARFRAAQDALPQPVDEHFADAVNEVNRLEAETKRSAAPVKKPAKTKSSRSRKQQEDEA